MSFANETTIRATRKDHRCDACNKTIPTGSAAVRWSGVSDGEFMTADYHSDCREAEIHLNGLYGCQGDEWIGLRDREREDHAWLLTDFPEVAARLGIVTGAVYEGAP